MLLFWSFNSQLRKHPSLSDSLKQGSVGSACITNACELPPADAGFRKIFIDKFHHILQISIFQSCRLTDINLIYYSACSKQKFFSSPLSASPLSAFSSPLFDNLNTLMLTTVIIYNPRQYQIRVFLIDQFHKK